MHDFGTFRLPHLLKLSKGARILVVSTNAVWKDDDNEKHYYGGDKSKVFVQKGSFGAKWWQILVIIFVPWWHRYQVIVNIIACFLFVRSFVLWDMNHKEQWDVYLASGKSSAWVWGKTSKLFRIFSLCFVASWRRSWDTSLISLMCKMSECSLNRREAARRPACIPW